MELLETILHSFVSLAMLLFEYIGVAVITFAGIQGILNYVRREPETRLILAKGLAMGLEFKLGSEILRTVIVRNLSEIYIVAGIIALRAILTFLIHWEIKNEENEGKAQNTESAHSANASACGGSVILQAAVPLAQAVLAAVKNEPSSIAYTKAPAPVNVNAPTVFDAAAQSRAAAAPADTAQANISDTSANTAQTGAQHTSDSAIQGNAQNSSDNAAQTDTQNTSDTAARTGAQNASDSTAQASAPDTSENAPQTGAQDSFGNTSQTDTPDASDNSAQASAQNAPGSTAQTGGRSDGKDSKESKPKTKTISYRK